jgi:hypothetical protein
MISIVNHIMVYRVNILIVRIIATFKSPITLGLLEKLPCPKHMQWLPRVTF